MTTQDANPVCRMHFNVTGMSCAACQARVEKVVSGLDGVENVAVNLLKNTMEVTPKDASQANELTQAIEAAVSEAGYGAQRTDPGAKNASAVPSRAETVAAEAAEVKTRLIYSIMFLVLLMYVSMGSMMGLPMPDWLGTMNPGSCAAFCSSSSRCRPSFSTASSSCAASVRSATVPRQWTRSLQ